MSTSGNIRSRLTPSFAQLDLDTQSKPAKSSHSSMTLPTPPQTRRRRNSLRRIRRLADVDEEKADEEEEEDTELDDDDRPQKRRRVATNEPHTPKKGSSELPLFFDNPNFTAQQPLAKTETTVATGGAAMSIASPPSTPTKSLMPPSSFLFQTPKRPTTRRVLDPVERNPFLDSDDDGDDENPFISRGVGPTVVAAGKKDNIMRSRMEERPSMTYVFRGKKVQYPNPYFLPPIPRSPSPSPAPRSGAPTTRDLFADTASIAAKSVRARAREEALAVHAKINEAKAKGRLPIEHEDYEMFEGCGPTILFPRAKKGLN